MKFTRHDLPYDSYGTWKALCDEGTFQRVSPSALSDLLPESLLAKANSVLVMASGISLISVYVTNLNRVDKTEIDQHPYIIAFDHNASTTSGGFIDHGKWDNRSNKHSKDFFDLVAASGITAYYPLAEMPSATSGLLDDLKIDSQRNAFWTSFSALKSSF